MFLYNEIKLDAPVNLVFDFLSKFKNIPLWNYYVMNVWQDIGEQGTLYHQIRKNDQQTFKVVEESKPNIKKAVEENLLKLKQLLENGFTVLQDGRESNLIKNKSV